MATTGVTDRLCSVSFSSKTSSTNTTQANGNNPSEEESNSREQILLGAKLSDARDFLNKDGKNVSLTPIIVDFRRLIQSRSSVDVVPGVPNLELMHATAALYNTSLSEMTPDVLYACLCDKQARTILLLRDAQEAVDALNSSHKCQDGALPSEAKETDTETLEEKDDVYEAGQAQPSVYHGVYSDQDLPDTDSEGDDDEEESDDEDFSKGIHTFLRNVRKRRRKLNDTSDQVTLANVGIEHRLVGALTFEKTYCNPGEKIIHLTLVSVRKKYRKWGIGKYLVTTVKDMSVVGQYEAVVVHADNSAVDFFQRYAFTDDLLLNSRWSELAEQYTNCTLMSYLPPFTNHSLLGAAPPELDIMAVDKEIAKWRERSMEAYRAEMSCVGRLRHEIVHLRALVASQQDLITSLVSDNERLKQDNYTVEKDFLEYRMSSQKSTFTTNFSDDEEDLSAETLIRELEQEAKEAYRRSAATRRKAEALTNGRSEPADTTQTEQRPTEPYDHKSTEPYDHGKDAEDFYRVTQDFYAALKADTAISTCYEVQMVTKAVLSPSCRDGYKTRTSQLGDDGLTARLYFCGSLERPHRIPEILRTGFSEQDLTHGEYGRGLYFSKYPSKAAHFSALGMLLVAEVALGSTESVMTKDKARTRPGQYFHSIFTPGRLSSEEASSLCQEYVVFDVHQACPLYLVTYKPAPDKPAPDNPATDKAATNSAS